MKSILSLLLPLFLIQNLSGQSISLEEPIRFLALGDSYTIGHSVSEDMRWPVQLSDSLAARGLEVGTTDIIATTGWTTANLLNAIENQNPGVNDYNLVSLLIGVNNQYQGQDFSIYQPQFEQLLDSCLAYVGGDPSKVFIVSIPDYAYTPFGQNSPDPSNISDELDQYNAVNKMVAENYGIKYFDITPISRMGIDQPDLVATDGLHPSGLQYTKWVEKILAFLDGTTSTETITALPSLSVSPNPTSERLLLEFPEGLKADSLAIFNRQGQIVFSAPLSGNKREEIALSDLSNGWYILRVYSDEKATGQSEFILQK